LLPQILGTIESEPTHIRTDFFNNIGQTSPFLLLIEDGSIALES